MKKRPRDSDSEAQHNGTSYPTSIIYSHPAYPPTQRSFRSTSTHPPADTAGPNHGSAPGTQLVYYVPGAARFTPPPHGQPTYPYQHPPQALITEDPRYQGPPAPPANIHPGQLQLAYTSDGTPVYILPAADFHAPGPEPGQGGHPPTALPSRASVEQPARILNLAQPPPHKAPRYAPPTRYVPVNPPHAALNPPRSSYSPPNSATHVGHQPTHYQPPPSPTYPQPTYHPGATTLRGHPLPPHPLTAAHDYGPRPNTTDLTTHLRATSSAPPPSHAPHAHAPHHQTLYFVDPPKPSPPTFIGPTPPQAPAMQTHQGPHLRGPSHQPRNPPHPQPPAAAHRQALHLHDPQAPARAPPHAAPHPPAHHAQPHPFQRELHHPHPPPYRTRKHHHQPPPAELPHPPPADPLRPQPTSRRAATYPPRAGSPGSPPPSRTPHQPGHADQGPGNSPSESPPRHGPPNDTHYARTNAVPRSSLPGTAHPAHTSAAPHRAGTSTLDATPPGPSSPRAANGAVVSEADTQTAPSNTHHTHGRMAPHARQPSTEEPRSSTQATSTSGDRPPRPASPSAAPCQPATASDPQEAPAHPDALDRPPSALRDSSASPPSTSCTESDPNVRPPRSGAPSPPSTSAQPPSPTSQFTAAPDSPGPNSTSTPPSPPPASPLLPDPASKAAPPPTSRPSLHQPPPHHPPPLEPAAAPLDPAPPHRRTKHYSYTFPPANPHIYGLPASPSASPTTTTLPHLKPDPAGGLPIPPATAHAAIPPATRHYDSHPPAHHEPFHRRSPPSTDSPGPTSSDAPRPPMPLAAHPGDTGRRYLDAAPRVYTGTLKVHRNCQHEGCTKRARASTHGKPMFCMVHMRTRGLAPKAPMCQHPGCPKFAQQSADKSRDFCVVHMKERGQVPNALSCQHPGCSLEARRACNTLRRFCPRHMRLYGVCLAPNTPGLRPPNSANYPLSRPCRHCKRCTPLSPSVDRSPPNSPPAPHDASPSPPSGPPLALHGAPPTHHTYIIPANSSQAVRLPPGYAIQLPPDARTYATNAPPSRRDPTGHRRAVPVAAHGQAGGAGRPPAGSEGPQSPHAHQGYAPRPGQAVEHTALPPSYVVQVDPEAPPYPPPPAGVYHINSEYLYAPAYASHGYSPEDLPPSTAIHATTAHRTPTIVSGDQSRAHVEYSYTVALGRGSGSYPLADAQHSQGYAEDVRGPLETRASTYYYASDGSLVAAVDARHAPPVHHHSGAAVDARHAPAVRHH